MKLSTKIKTEKAFAGYVPTILSSPVPHIYEGHEDADEMEFPSLVVYAEDAQPHPEMPVETGTKIVRLRFRFQFDASASGRERLDAWREEIEEAMRCTASIQAALNRPESGVDSRKVQAIHFHEVQPAGEPSEREETDWVEELSFDVVCEPLSY